MPTGPADLEVTYQTRPEQALLYRLTGDRNPLHSDPVFAARGGFERPILHGMCTYGFTGRALLHAVCGSDPARFRTMEGRFTRPVLPGDALTVSIWVDGTTAYFRTICNGAVVIDRGRLSFV
jgi:acyl dehydratase